MVAALWGFIGVLALHLQIVALWPSLYSLHPWRGYEWAMSQGLVQAHFVNSPLAQTVSIVGFAVLGLAGGSFLGRPFPS